MVFPGAYLVLAATFLDTDHYHLTLTFALTWHDFDYGLPWPYSGMVWFGLGCSDLAKIGPGLALFLDLDQYVYVLHVEFSSQMFTIVF